MENLLFLYCMWFIKISKELATMNQWIAQLGANTRLQWLDQAH